jgi:uncharacterized protein (TIGR03435 family)
MRYIIIVVIAVAAATASAAQTAGPQFDVVSVKPALPERSLDELLGAMAHPRPGQWRVLSLTLHNLIILAYPEFRFQRLVVGEPGWLDEARFDVDARMSPAATQNDVLQMQRHLLASRFGLRTHTEKRTVDAYALMLASPGKLGPGVTPARPACVQRRMIGGAPSRECDLWRAGAADALMTSAASIADLITFFTLPAGRAFQNAIDRPVVDRTGLEGFFQIIGPSPRMPPGESPASFFTLIQEQLGLKLVPVREAVDVLVIDRVERPSEN